MYGHPQFALLGVCPERVQTLCTGAIVELCLLWMPHTLGPDWSLRLRQSTLHVLLAYYDLIRASYVTLVACRSPWIRISQTQRPTNLFWLTH